MPQASAWLPWVAACAAGLLAAAVGYWPASRRAAVPALLRALAVGLVTALLLDAPAASVSPAVPLAAVDASASAARAGRLAAWRAAVAAARATGDALAFGDSLRPLGAAAAPADQRSGVRPAIDRAAALGRPLVLYTDGELDDADDADEAALPAGSRVVRIERAGGAAPDAALADVALPRVAAAGDTVRATLRVRAGGAGAAATSVAVALDGRVTARAPVPALGPFAETAVDVAFTAPPRGPAVVAFALAAGDAEPANDSLGAALDVGDAAGAVSVSTSPDYDWRYATALLREASAAPVRGYVRVAPGAWRDDATLRPVAEGEVRARLRGASLALLHGDTAAFGPPVRATTGALVLLPAGRSTEDGEWYVGPAPASPLSAALADAPWDSLPPLDPPGPAGAATWTALTARLVRRGDPAPVVVGREGARRTVVVLASGLFRWHTHGGVAARAYASLWGTIFDWAGGDPAPRQPVAVADVVARAGEPIRWRRSADAPDSVPATLARRGGAARPVMVRFAAGSTLGESAPLDAGVYDVSAAGSRSVLVVNRSREWLPRRPAALVARGDAAAGARRGLRALGWPFVAAVLLLCGEWLLRRRAGWR